MAEAGSAAPAHRPPVQWLAIAAIAAGSAATMVIGREVLGLTPILDAVSEEPVVVGGLSILLSLVIIGIAVRLPTRSPAVVRDGLVLGGYGAAAAVLALGALGALDGGGDARILYDHPWPDPYTESYRDLGFAYSPTVALALYPFVQLPWGLFLGGWTAVLLVALVRLSGPSAPLLMLAPLVALDVQYGNVNLLIAFAIARGLSRPAWWAVVLHTKVTPGVGLVWFAIRRDWRRLAVALLVSAILVVPPVVLQPGIWLDWVRVVVEADPAATAPWLGPLWLRVLAATALIAWGARTERPWTVAAGALLAIPVAWPATVTLLVAAIPLARPADPRRSRRAVDRALADPV